MHPDRSRKKKPQTSHRLTTRPTTERRQIPVRHSHRCQQRRKVSNQQRPSRQLRPSHGPSPPLVRRTRQSRHRSHANPSVRQNRQNSLVTLPRHGHRRAPGHAAFGNRIASATHPAHRPLRQVPAERSPRLCSLLGMAGKSTTTTSSVIDPQKEYPNETTQHKHIHTHARETVSLESFTYSFLYNCYFKLTSV